jgi:DNA-binding CsgD family transcriptional regulator
MTAVKQRNARRLDQDMSEDGRPLHEVLVATGTPDTETRLVEKIHLDVGREKLADAMKCLSERERRILNMYYVQELSQDDIAEILGVTPSRISQLRKRAFGKLLHRVNPELKGELKREAHLANEHVITTWKEQTGVAAVPKHEVDALRARISASRTDSSHSGTVHRLSIPDTMQVTRAHAPERSRPEGPASSSPILGRVAQATGQAEADLLQLASQFEPSHVAETLRIPLGHARVLKLLANRS